METIAREVSQVEGVSLEAMRRPGQDRSLSRGRLVTAWVGREVGKFPIAQAAKYFHRDTSTLARGVARLEESMTTSERLRASVSRIAKQLRP